MEESAAAAESLRDQAKRLSDSMQFFRLSAGQPSQAVVATYRPAPAPTARSAPPAPSRPPEVAKAAISQARETSRPAAAAPSAPAASDDWESF